MEKQWLCKSLTGVRLSYSPPNLFKAGLVKWYNNRLVSDYRWFDSFILHLYGSVSEWYWDGLENHLSRLITDVQVRVLSLPLTVTPT